MAFNVSYIYQIVDKFSPQIKQITKGANTANAAIKKLSKSSLMLDKNLVRLSGKNTKLNASLNSIVNTSKKLNAQLGKNAPVKSVNDLGKNVLTSQKRVSALSKEVLNLNKYLRTSENLSLKILKNFKSMRSSFKVPQGLRTTNQQLSRTVKSALNLNHKIDGLNNRLNRINPSKVNALAGAFSVASKSPNGLNVGVKRLNTQLDLARMKSNQLRGELFDVAATAFVLSRPVKSAIIFETSLTDIKKAVDFESPKQFREMTKDIRALGLSTGFGAAGIADIITQGGKMGIPAKNLAGFADTVSKISVALDLIPADAANKFGLISEKMNIPIENIGQLADAITHLENTTAATGEGMLRILSRVSGTMATLKVAPTEAAGIAAVFQKATPTIELASSAFNMLIGRMKAVPSLRKALEQDPKGGILKFLEKLKIMTSEKRRVTMEDILGKEVQLTNTINTLVNGLDGVKKTMAQVESSTKFSGSALKEYNLRANTAAFGVEKFKASMQDASISITTGFLPVISAVASGISLFASGFAGFADRAPFIVNSITFLTAALIALRLISIASIFTANQLKIAWLQVSAVAKILKLDILLLKPALAGVQAFALATALDFKILGVAGGSAALGMKALSIAATVAKFALRSLLIATGIGAVLVGLGLIAENAEWIKQKFIEIKSGISNFLDESPKLQMLGKVLGFIFKPFILGVGLAWDAAKILFGFVTNSIMFIADIIGAITPDFSTIESAFISLVNTMISGLNLFGLEIAKIPIPDEFKKALELTANIRTPNIDNMINAGVFNGAPQQPVNSPDLLSPQIFKQELKVSGNITVSGENGANVKGLISSNMGDLGVML